MAKYTRFPLVPINWVDRNTAVAHELVINRATGDLYITLSEGEGDDRFVNIATRVSEYIQEQGDLDATAIYVTIEDPENPGTFIKVNLQELMDQLLGAIETPLIMPIGAIPDHIMIVNAAGNNISTIPFTKTDLEGFKDKYTKSEIDTKFTEVTSDRTWQEAVATEADLYTTYPDAEEGWTASVNDVDSIFRFDGTIWKNIGGTTINKATETSDGLLSKEDYSLLRNYDSRKDTFVDTEVLNDFKVEIQESFATIESVFVNKGGTTLSRVMDHNMVGGIYSAMIIGGRESSSGSVNNYCDLYNGTSWAEGADLNIARTVAAVAGTAETALISSEGTSETYNTLTWSNGPNTISNRIYLSGNGVYNNALATGGYIELATVATTELFNGTTWTSNATMNSIRGYHTTLGITNNMIVLGGKGVGSAVPDNNTEQFDGLSWSISKEMIIKDRTSLSGAGIATFCMGIGGSNSSSIIYQTTEIFNGFAWSAGPDYIVPVNRQASTGKTTESIITGGINNDGVLNYSIVFEPKSFDALHDELESLEVDVKALSSLVNPIKIENVPLLTENWILDNTLDLYAYTITNENIKVNSNIVIDFTIESVRDAKFFGIYPNTKVNEGNTILYSDLKPSYDLIIDLLIV